MSTVIHTATTMRGATKHAWVECEITSGIGIHVVGPIEQNSVPEILLRVVIAIEATGYTLPGKKIVINVRREMGTERRKDGKVGSWFDLPIALAILVESGKIHADKKELAETIFVGELALDGKIRPADGGFLHPADTARAVSWKFRDERSTWGWKTDGKGGDTWLDLEDLKDAIELLMAHDAEEGCRV